jgi:hypothetical protein
MIAFIVLIIRWSLNYGIIETKTQLIIKLVLIVYAALHILIIYVYQFSLFQAELDPGSFAMRIVGLPQILYAKCEQPAHLFMKDNVRVERLIHPFCLMLLYWFIAVELAHDRKRFARIYLNGVTSRDTETTIVGGGGGVSPPAAGKATLAIDEETDEDEDADHVNERNAYGDEAFGESAGGRNNRVGGGRHRGLPPPPPSDMNDTTLLSDDVMDESEKQV